VRERTEIMTDAYKIAHLLNKQFKYIGRDYGYSK